jgi:hypothetical protein
VSPRTTEKAGWSGGRGCFVIVSRSCITGITAPCKNRDSVVGGCTTVPSVSDDALFVRAFLGVCWLESCRGKAVRQNTGSHGMACMHCVSHLRGCWSGSRDSLRVLLSETR